MNSEKQKMIISQEEWENKMDGIKIPREQMNRLVMNFLITQGYLEASSCFEKESKTQIINDDHLKERDEIRTSILCGDIDRAIFLINSISSSILESYSKLMFELKLQKLVNYIRENKISEALAYGQEVLAPAAQGNNELLKELEKAMSLIAFNDIFQSPLAEICSPMHKLRLANEVNAGVLQYLQSESRASTLTDICKILILSQKKLQKTLVFPIKK